jgi:hypothetical protein
MSKKPAITANKPELGGNRPRLSGGKPKITKNPLARIFEPPAGFDPLGEVAQTGDLETDAQAEVSAVLSGFQDRARQEQARFELATDTEFWFSVYFQSREQKEAFLKALEWLTSGDKYLNGLELAEAMGIELPKVSLPKPRPFNRKLLNLVKR